MALRFADLRSPAIRHPIEWGLDQFRFAARAVGREDAAPAAGPVIVRRIGLADLRAALAAGLEDFSANRSDVLFLSVIYPLLGLLLARLAFGYDMLPLLFPLAAGFALIGPFAAVGLNEMSRRRALGGEVGWSDAFGVLASPALGPILLLGLILASLFGLWLIAAAIIFDHTLGPAAPASLAAFAHDVLATRAGWAMIGLGLGVGFVFALVVLMISAVAFPLLLDRHAGLETAIWTSVRATATNPGPMACWGLIVAFGLVIGSVPALLGLAVVMPVLGHATWHLYRRLVAPAEPGHA